jgi:hypothetical protein
MDVKGIAVAVAGFAAGFALAAAVAQAVDVQLAPQACWYHSGTNVVDAKHGILGYGLIFNACEPEFKWLKVPAAPDAEV